MNIPPKSQFHEDLKKEKTLAQYLNRCYERCLKQYRYLRVHDKKQQFRGVDVIFTHKTHGHSYAVDEKAQLNYLNEDLPTFAFEIAYHKQGVQKKGWLFDSHKTTDFYALITAIYTDAPDTFTSCKITMVNRKKLLLFLKNRGITHDSFMESGQYRQKEHGPFTIEGLDGEDEGYGFHSLTNKHEQPLNIVLRLEFLNRMGIGKRLL